MELVRAKKYEQARSEFEAVVKADPGNGRAAALLAAMEMQTGYVKSAVARAEILVDKDPKNPDLHELLAQGYMVVHDWAKAEREWRWMTAAQPNSDQAHMQLALALMERDQYEPALAAAGRALEINPKRGDARSLRGNILASLGRMDEASREWTTALAANPGDTVALAGLAVYWQKSEPNRALDYAKRAVDLSGGRNLGPLRVLAMVYRARGETDEARKVLERARLLYPNNEVVAAELRALRAPAAATAPTTTATAKPVPPPVRPTTPTAPPPVAGLTGLTLGAVARDLMPLVKLPARPTAVAASRPANSPANLRANPPVNPSAKAPANPPVNPPARTPAPVALPSITPPPPPPASTAGFRGLTLGTVARDLMPLVKLPQRPLAPRAGAPSYVAARPARPADPAPARVTFPVLPLYMNTPVFVYSDVVSRPAPRKK